MDIIYEKGGKWYSGKLMYDDYIIYIDGEEKTKKYNNKDIAFTDIKNYLIDKPRYSDIINNFIDFNEIDSMYVRYFSNAKKNICSMCANKCKHHDVYGCNKFISRK
jgi:hypothetical protein